MEGKNVEGLDVVGHIFVKDKCHLCVKLCAALLFMHLFLWVFHVYAAYVFLLLLCMNLCIRRVLYVLIWYQSSNFWCGIAQLVDGDVTIIVYGYEVW
jgi:hypothetical protein